MWKEQSVYLAYFENTRFVPLLIQWIKFTVWKSIYFTHTTYKDQYTNLDENFWSLSFTCRWF